MFEYAKHNLLNNETILYEAKFHWFIYLPALFFFGMMFFFPFEALYVVSCIVLGLLVFTKFYIMKLSTEFVVTNMRVIVKTGLISRNTVELNHRNVESVSLDQGILGRILNYGTLTLNGTGAGISPIPYIDDPLEFRKQVLNVVHQGRPANG